MRRTSSKANKFFPYILLYFLNPFLSFILAVRNFSYYGSKIIIILFFVFLGATYRPSFGADGYSNYENFLIFGSMSFSQIVNHTILSFAAQGIMGIEQFQAITSFIVSRFSLAMSTIYSVWALIFGLIYISVISPLYELYLKNGRTRNTLIFFLAFILFIPIIQALNGRFWFAYWYFIYCLYNYIVEKEKKFIYFSVLTPLIHQGLIFAPIILVIYFISSKLKLNKDLILYSLVIISYTYSFFSLDIGYNFLEFIGGNFETRGSVYLSKVNTPFVDVSRPWFLELNLNLIFFVSIFLMIFYKFKFGKFWSDTEKELFSFTLIFWSFVNFISNIPSLGGRYRTILNGIVLLLLFLINVKYNQAKYFRVYYLMIPALLLYLAVEFRIWTDFINEYFLVLNPVLAFFVDYKIGLWKFISGLL